MSDDLATGTLAFKVVCDCLRLEEQKVAALNDECDRYVHEIVALTSELARVKADAERSAAGYETANLDMHRAMVRANRDRDEARRLLDEVLR